MVKLFLIVTGFLCCLLFHQALTQPSCGSHCPVFSDPSYHGSVLENATESTPVLTVHASNINGDGMYYGITYLGSGLPFDIDPSGTIHVSGPLNYQLMPRYEFTVTATMYLGYSTFVTCVIDILDVLDPVLCKPDPILVRIKEDIAAGTNTLQCINCTSPEQPNEKLQYIVSSPIISIDDNGHIWLNETLDYENQTTYNLSLKFTDSNGNNLQGISYIDLAVIFVNEYPPNFNETSYEFSITEGRAVGTLVGMVTASDDDGGTDGQLEYSLVNGTDLFYISSDTGEIYSTIVFDHEAEISVYQLLVSVSDKPTDTLKTLTDTVTVTVTVIDINDNPPVFVKDEPYIVNVTEDAVLNSVIATIECIDKDSTGNDMIEYILLSGNGTFAVNQSNGDILLKVGLDYEQLEYYQLELKCIDPNIDTFFAKSTVYIKVLDANEHTPYFTTNSSISVRIANNIPPGTIIAEFEAVDEDSGKGGELRYSIEYTESSCPRVLGITSTTGRVFSIDESELQVGELINCSIIVQDQQPPIKTAKGQLIVTIVNGKNNPPVCYPGIIVVYKPENTSLWALISTLNCTDGDGSGDELEYTVTSGDQFAVNQSTGELTLTQHLDYESQTVHEIKVTVSDSKYSVLSTVLLVLEPVNEYQPVFMNESLYCIVSESANAGTGICTITAQDYDDSPDGVVKYYFDSEQESFTIDSNTGIIYLMRTLDYEDTHYYEVIVYAQDESTDQMTSTATVSIDVLDINDNYPMIDRYMYTSIEENADSGEVVFQLNCTDKDTGDNGNTSLVMVSVTAENHYGLTTNVSDGSNPFALNDHVIVLNNGGLIDYESVSRYHVDIACHDNGQPAVLSSQATIYVTVDNVNEYTPYFEEQSIVQISFADKPGTELVQLSAADNDYNDVLHYSMTLIEPAISPPMLFLELEYNTGIVKIVSEVNCDYGFQLTYNVTVSDSGSLTDQTKISFSITDCTNPPLPVNGSYVLTSSIMENSTSSTELSHMQCYTPNSTPLPPGISIMYNLDNYKTDFSVNTSTGVIYTQSVLDYETVKLYEVLGSCYYTYNPQVVLSFTIFIQVIPVNEHSPSFNAKVMNISISEDAGVGSLVTMVNATDDDDGMDGELEYSIHKSETGDDIFVICPESGSIYLKTKLDREVQNMYNITVMATDHSEQNRQTSEITLNVMIEDVNDSPPLCSSIVYHTTVPISSSPGTVVLDTLNCIDKDTGVNGKLTYTLNTDSSNTIRRLPLGINHSTGQIYLTESITDITDTYNTVSVTVSDSGHVPLATTVYISVTVAPAIDTLIVTDDTLMKQEVEGLENNVTANITDMAIHQWTSNTEKVFQETVATMATFHCALYPSSCSILTACPNLTIESSCSEYMRFSISDVVVLHEQLTEEQQADSVHSLHIRFYVLLPSGIARALRRKTDYVIPQNTVDTIITDNHKTISVMVRDSISESPQAIATAWKQLAIGLVVVVLVLSTCIFFAVVSTKLYKKIKNVKNKSMVHPMEMGTQRRRITTPAVSSVSTGGGTISGSTINTSIMTVPSSSSGHSSSGRRHSPLSETSSFATSSTMGNASNNSSNDNNPNPHVSSSRIRQTLLQRLKMTSAKQHNHTRNWSTAAQPTDLPSVHPPYN